MIYKLTSANEVIARIENNFDIDYADWISRAPVWIADAMDRLKLVSAYEEAIFPTVIEEYACELPNDSVSDIKRILGVEYRDMWLKRIGIVAPKRMVTYNTRNISRETYTIKNSHIITSFEEGEVNIYYDRPAIEYNSLRQVYLPKVPENSIAQDAISWYLIYCMLKRGHKHPIYSLDSKNPLTNPYLMWIDESKKARNSCGAMDREERENFSIMLRTFAVNLENPTFVD
jgi:hypothetical protein